MEKAKQNFIGHAILFYFLFVSFFNFINAQQRDLVTSAKTNAKPRMFGFYKTKLPCSDCEGILFSLKFSESDKVEQQSIYLGKSDVPIIVKGKFNFANDSIIVLSFTDSLLNRSILKRKNNLLLLDKNQKVIEGKAANQYVLKKSLDESQMKAALINKKRKDGVTFYAESKQQKWSFDIYKRDFLLYKKSLKSQADTFEINKWVDNAERGVSSIEAANGGSKKLVINLYKQFCGDSLKGDIHAYLVMIRDSIERQGCGDELIPMPRMETVALNNIWILEKMGSIIIDKAKAKKVPTLEIHEKELSFNGNGGCNTISGTLKLEKSKISFDNITASKMLCHGSIEPEFLEMLKKVESYIIAKNKLILRGKAEILSIFTRVN